MPVNQNAERMRQYAVSPDYRERIRAARAVSTPEEVLDALAHDTDERVREAAMRNTRFALLDWVVTQLNNGSLESLRDNPGIWQDERIAPDLAVRASDLVSTQIAAMKQERHSGRYAGWEELPYQELLRKIVCSPVAPRWLGIQFQEYDDGEYEDIVRGVEECDDQTYIVLAQKYAEWVAQDHEIYWDYLQWFSCLSTIPLEAAETLARIPIPWVQANVAAQYPLSSKTLEYLLEHDDLDVACAVAECPSLTADIAAALIETGNPEILIALVSRGDNISQMAGPVAIVSSNGTARLTAIQNGYAHLASANDRNVDVRAALAAHSTDPDVLEILSLDKSQKVRKQVRENPHARDTALVAVALADN